MGSRESKNIILPPSVNLHLSLKNAPQNDEHSLGENGLTARPQHHLFYNMVNTGSRSGSPEVQP